MNVRPFSKLERREMREIELGKLIRALPSKKFGIIYADPEWRFEPYSRITGMDRAADNHYPTSPLDDISRRDVGSIAAKDAALFLWATGAMLPHALQVMADWGFAYKSNLVWVKDKVGLGYWFRSQHELLLVGTRGNFPAPAPGTQWSSVLLSPRREHSRKPDEVATFIENYWPNTPKIELNRRGPPRAGWDAWGNEVTA